MPRSVWQFDDEPDEFLAAPNYPPPEPEPDNTPEDDPLDPTRVRFADHNSSGRENPDDEGFVDVEGIDGEPGEDTEGTEHWSPERGFPDPTGAVRVWMTPDFELQRVRVSLNWRHKLKDSSLDEAFGIIFMAINAVHLRDQLELPDPEPLPAEPYPGPFGWHTLQHADREHAKVDAELAALGEVEPTKWVGDNAIGTSYQNGLTITLGIFGEPISAIFDPEWLKTDLRSSEIANAVRIAHKKARKHHTPPTVTFGQRELLARKHDQITRSMLASFRNGIQTNPEGPIIRGTSR